MRPRHVLSEGKILLLFVILWVIPDWTYGNGDHFDLSRLRLPPDFAANSVSRVLLDKKGFVWLFTLNNSFYRFDGNSVTEAADMFSKTIRSYSTLRPFIDAQNNLWIGDLEKLCRINLNTFERREFIIPAGHRRVNKKIADITGVGDIVYVATEEGQIFENKGGRGFQSIVNLAETLSASAITHVAVFESSLYFTVANHGIFKRDSHGKVTRVRFSETDDGGRTNCVWLHSDGGSLFAHGNFDGLLQIRQHQARRVAITQVNQDWNCYPLQNNYFVRFLDNETRIEKLEGDRLTITDRFATSTRHREDKSGLFLRNSLGVYRIKPIQKELFTDNQYVRDFNAQHISIRHIARRRGSLLLGTYEGFFKTTASGQFQRLTNTIVYTSFEDQQGTIWLGTEGGGLKRLSDQDSVVSVNATNGLDNLYITAIEALTDTTLLIGTYQGFYVFDTHLRKWTRLAFTTDPYPCLLDRDRKSSI